MGGSLDLFQTQYGVSIIGTLKGLPTGQHGLAVHEGTRCEEPGLVYKVQTAAGAVTAVVWTNDSLVPNVIFELRPNLESLWKSTSDEPIRFGDKARFRPKKLTWNLDFWVFGFGQKTPWCWGGLDKRLLGVLFQRGGLDKRLLGVRVVWTKDSLVLIQPWLAPRSL